MLAEPPAVGRETAALPASSSASSASSLNRSLVAVRSRNGGGKWSLETEGMFESWVSIVLVGVVEPVGVSVAACLCAGRGGLVNACWKARCGWARQAWG